MKKIILKQAVSNPCPSEIKITPKLLIDEFIYIAKKVGITNDAGTDDCISVGQELISYTKNLVDLKQEGGIGNVSQFELQNMPQDEAEPLVESELNLNQWGFVDAMRLISDLVARRYFDERNNVVSVALKETFSYSPSSGIHFKLEAYRNLYGNLSLNIIMHWVSVYNLNCDLKEGLCDEGKGCRYILKN